MSAISTHLDQSLILVSSNELKSNDCDSACRYAVGASPLPQESPSSWAMELKSVGWSGLGVIADPSLEINDGWHNTDHPTFSGWYAITTLEAHTIFNGDGQEHDGPRVDCSDVMLFHFQPKEARLTIVNSRTREKSVIHINTDQPLFISTILAHVHQPAHVVLRTTTVAEQNFLISPTNNLMP
jgi:hypothetical protein